MHFSEPGTVVMPAKTAAVLRALVGTSRALSVRDLARLAHTSPARTSEIVARLDEHGLVDVEEAGGAKLCRFNHEHVAAKAVADLVGMRRLLLDLLRSEISSWSVQPAHASLFGSAARGDGDTRSDIDLLLVRASDVDADAWDTQLATAADRLRRATGNAVSWFDLDLDGLRAAVRAGEGIVDEWRRTALHLCGTPLAELLRSAA